MFEWEKLGVGYQLTSNFTMPSTSYETSISLNTLAALTLGLSLPQVIQPAIFVDRRELVVDVNVSGLRAVCLFLNKSSLFAFKLLIDLVVYDRPNYYNRFSMSYVLSSIRFAARMRVRTATNSVTAVRSIIGIYANVKWLEREAFDFFSILFIGNWELCRILCDYGYPGYPGLKDFLLFGWATTFHSHPVGDIISEVKGMFEASGSATGGWQNDNRKQNKIEKILC